MTARVKLKPGQKGTKGLVQKYGDALLCVRYRYDEKNQTRMKTVELIIQEKPWSPLTKRFKDSTLVPVRIAFNDTALREQAKAAKGKWDPKERAWFIQFGKIKGTELEKFIILDASV
jgi:hypothetical protein